MDLRIVYYVAISADGFVATLDGGVDWLTPFQETGEDYGYADFFASIDGLIMGRTTYDQVLGFGEWPYTDKPCWVLSSRPLESKKPTIMASSESPDALTRRLAAVGYRRLWLVGGATTACAFENLKLVTDYILTVIPVFLGQGLSLFSAPVGTGRLVLAGTRTYAGGVAQFSYARH
jgi:dihydrofolate reductase